MKYKDYYYEEKKKANQSKYLYIMKNEKRQRNTMQKEQRNKESKGDNERMLNLKLWFWSEVRWAGDHSEPKPTRANSKHLN